MRRLIRTAAVLGVWLAATAPAYAVTVYNITSLGLTAPHANYGCPVGSANCLTSLDFQLAAPAAATGTITVNNAGNVASIDINIASIIFASVPAGGPNAVFTNVHYLGSVGVISSPTFVSQFPPGPGPGSVTGDFNGSPFSSSSTINNLLCSVTAGVGQCGMSIGPASFEVAGHNWLHTFDVFVSVPEASALLLALFGVAGGLTLRRR